MSVIIKPEELTLWYKLEVYDWVECRMDMLVIDYQKKTITTSYDYGEEVGIIVTAPFSKFELGCP
jgi:hypothetical protein